MTLHPSVMLAEGVEIPEAAWYQHGNVLTGGIKGHQVVVHGFDLNADGSLNIRCFISPEDEPVPLRFLES